MKRLPIILLLALAAGFSVHAEIPAGWGTNFTATLSAAKSSHKPALAFFTASWCGPCKLMSSITLADPVMVDALTNAECVAVDIDEHPDLATKFQISAVPTFILLAGGDSEVMRSTGFQAIQDFLPWLTNGISATKLAEVQQARAQQSLAEVDQLLGSTDTNATRQAAAKLLLLCDERDPDIVQAAAERMKIVADRDPAALLDGLIDPHLATRIQAANALRYKLGDKFDVDPWADAAVRRKQVLALRQVMGK